VAGNGNAVVEVRSRYQQAIEMSVRAEAARATSRRVVSFACATNLSSNWVIEAFRLGALDPAIPEEPGDG